jgi:aryl carrier-like protein
VDRQGGLQAPGLVGELLIGGGGVSLGYWGDTAEVKALNAQRFVTLALEGGAQRYYRSGDRVRWREDGQLEYLGRMDRQLKLRGYRVEPGEIEQQILALGAQACAVDVLGDGEGQLLASVVGPVQAGEGWLQELREQLRQRLPGYMQPGRWQCLPALPVNANGKVDRAALLASARAQPAASAVSSPLNGDMEFALADLWTELFARSPSQLSANSNFFDLGGHSLLLMRLSNLVRTRLGANTDLQDLFGAADLRAMAACIAAAKVDAQREVLEW